MKNILSKSKAPVWLSFILFGVVLLMASCNDDNDATPKMSISAICDEPIEPTEISINGEDVKKLGQYRVSFQKSGPDTTRLDVSVKDFYPSNGFPSFTIPCVVCPSEDCIRFSSDLAGQNAGQTNVKISGEINKDKEMKISIEYTVVNTPLIKTSFDFSSDDIRLFSLKSLNTFDLFFNIDGVKYNMVDVSKDGLEEMKRQFGKVFKKIRLEFGDNGKLAIWVIWNNASIYEKWMEVRYWLSDETDRMFLHFTELQAKEFCKVLVNNPSSATKLFQTFPGEGMYQWEMTYHIKNYMLSIAIADVVSTKTFLCEWMDNKALVGATDKEKSILVPFRYVAESLTDVGPVFDGIYMNSYR